MDINGVTNLIPNGGDVVAKKNDYLGKDEFLKLLTVQLQNQDPLNALNDTDFIAQMAQFSSLEQMQNLNSTVSFSHAAGFIGKNVVASKINSNGRTEMFTGMVESVYFKSEIPYLKVGDQYVSLNNIQTVYEEVEK